MTLYQKIMATYVVVINIIAYLFMCFDKYQSKKKGQRISENNLLFLAFILGSLGIYMGMKAPIYHKAAKAKFKIVIPLMLILNTVFICLICYLNH
jgi:uncharacterized membrane protein YsdA (DUF1294 family)